MLARQAFYHLSQFARLFCVLGIFEIGFHFLPDLASYQSS
jgi:hypothetical protein